MLAHELRRRMAAVRIVGEAIATLPDQGLDITPMLQLPAETGGLDALAGALLSDRRPRPAEAAPDVADAVQAAARTVAAARGATVRVQVEVVVADRGDGGREAPAGHGIGRFVVGRFLDEAGGTSWVAPRDGGGPPVGLRVPLRPAAEPEPLDNAVNT